MKNGVRLSGLPGMVTLFMSYKERHEKDAIRVFKTVSKANETCRHVWASVTEQCPEADMEKLWIYENR